MAQGQGNTANGKLIKGAGCGTRQWQDDVVYTDVDGVTALFKIAQADGSVTMAAAVTSPAVAASQSFALTGIETGLTAHAGGTQAAALALSATKIVHNVTTVGTAADSVALPLATGSGKVHFVKNSAAANSMQVYGSGTDTIDGVATATGVAVAAGKAALFVDYAAGTWIRLAGA